jgi:glycosyltransferase involved in cell wall biosynthesis
MAGYYLPSVKGGGPIQSIKSIVNNFSDDIDFFIVAADRDLGDNKPFDNIVIDKWTKVGNTQVYYTNLSLFNWRKIKKIIEDLDCDILYLNSFFSFIDSIIPIFLHKFKVISNIKIILAPRGQFSKGALSLKSWKKKVFVRSSKLLNLHENIEWHATTEIEKKEIISIFGNNIKINIANNLTPDYKGLNHVKFCNKNVGELKLVYIARIHPMKNLLQTLGILKRIKGNIEFNIYGPIEDSLYWKKCQDEIKNIKQNVKVNYLGPIENNKINEVYKRHHVSVLMTLGENFGHSIAEALIGGCPVIISDRTPWRNLEEYNAGYDISLENEDEFIVAIENYIKMNDEEYQVVSISAFNYALTNSNTVDNIDSYLKMFDVHK